MPRPMQISLVKGAPRARPFEDAVFQGKAAGKGEIDHPFTLGGQDAGILVGFGMEVDRRHAPALHHVPGAHAGAAAGAVDGQQVKFGLGGEFDCHGQFFHAVGAGLQEMRLNPMLRR